MDSIKFLWRKKLEGGSIVETLVASILIMIVFGISLVTVGNVLERTVKSNTRFVDNELYRLEYLYKNGKIQAPDVIQTKDWRIEIDIEKDRDVEYIVFKATNKDQSKQIERKIVD